jgi:putative transposase
MDKQARLKLSDFLFNYAKEKRIFVKEVFVNADHIHTLIDLPTSISIEECIKLLKGASSHYINQNGLTKGKFRCGKGYGAFSVSPSRLVEVVMYIQSQEEHHRVKSFSEEYRLFLQKYGVNENG